MSCIRFFIVLHGLFEADETVSQIRPLSLF